MKLVSVIIPVYNCENYIKRCIDSIINQSYLNLEIIIINDGSTDNSDKILNEYKKKDSRIVYLNHDNHGPSFTRNVGIKKMKGDYFLFVDSDDELDLNYIKTMVKIIEKNNSDIVIGGSIDIDCYQNKYNIKNNYTVNCKNVNELWSKFAIDDISISIWGKLYKTKSCKSILFNEMIKNTEDKLYIFEMFKIIKKVSETNYNGYIHYFDNLNSLSRKWNDKVIDNLVFVENNINEFINKKLPDYNDIPISLTLLYICRNSIYFNKYKELKLIINSLLDEHKNDIINYKLISNKKNRFSLWLLKKNLIIYIFIFKFLLFIKRFIFVNKYN